MTNKASAHQTTDYVEGKAHEAVNRAARTTGKAEEYAREHVSDVDERVREAAAHGQKRAEDVLGGVNGYVRDNPLISIGIAFGAGVLLSSLRRRR